MIRRKRIATLVLVSALVATGAAAAPDAVPHTPILVDEVKAGQIVTSQVGSVTPSAKTVDGQTSDWTGSLTRIGGSALYSRGEYVYQDFINDAWGPDDGYDAGRLATLDTVQGLESRTYRIDALQQAAGDQFGASRPAGASLSYGDPSVADATRTQADIDEARVAADDSTLYVMVRTLNMAAAPSTGVLVLLDTAPGGSYLLPQSLGGITTGAELAILAHDGGVVGARDSGAPCLCPGVKVASDPSGYNNATEIGIPRALLGGATDVKVGIATGVVNSTSSPTGLAKVSQGDAKADLLNVAFRSERVRIWMDRNQALALRLGSIDSFLASVDIDRLESGANETFQMRPGYYEAVYVNGGSPVNFEGSTNGYFQGPVQHYGIFLPSTYRPGRTLHATFWMHYRGGHAHDAAAWLPGVMRNFGEETGGMVITPSARGTSSWYTGRGMVDFLDAWNDAMARLPIDQDRVYLAGHSMGGWASWLLGILFPDRWAASNPEDGLLVPALCVGAGVGASPQNGADLNAEQLYGMIENTRNLPYAILHGTADELVPATCAITAGTRMHQLGYRYRTYLYHTYEHFSAPIWDDWRDVVAYMMPFKRDANPARVTYKTWPALNNAVSTISVPTGVNLGFNFNGAYWVSGMATRTPGIAVSNVGTIDATTYGRGVPQTIAIPEAGAGLPGPYTMTGQAYVPNGILAAQNRFTATLTNLSTATLDLARMGLGTGATITATVQTDGASSLRLAGTWATAPDVAGASAAHDGGGVTLSFATSGTYTITITP